jgi:hypothetical protein
MRMFKDLSVIALLISGPITWAWAEDTVWESSKRQSNSIEGRIKAIVVNDSTNKILVKLESANESKNVQTLSMCNQDVADFNRFQQSEKMALIRLAFARGDKVFANIGGPFERCLSSIEYSRSEKAKTAEAIPSI